MKKAVVLVCVFVLAALLFTSCQRFKKISFSTESLGEVLDAHITENTSVIGSYELSAPKTVPMYSISKRVLTDDEYVQILSLLDIKEDDPKVFIDRKDNSLLVTIREPYAKKDYSVSDEETLRMEKEVFDKIPVISGEYECLGIKSFFTISDSEGDHGENKDCDIVISNLIICDGCRARIEANVGKYN